VLVFESHSGADTIPTAYQPQLLSRQIARGSTTILYEYVQALFDQQTRIEHDKAKAERQDIVTRSHF
jgi:hypothetical protein